jgi:hypothetical protein
VTALLALVIALAGVDTGDLVAWARAPDADPIRLARALARADLPILSTATLTETLVLKRTDPVIVAAALDLYPLSLRGQPPVDHVFAGLAAQPTTGLSPRHAALRAFLIGQALLVDGQAVAALRHLARVAPGSPAYAPARYLMGVAHVTPPLDDLKAAATHLREAIVEAESSPQAPRGVVREARRLALLGLARLSFEVGNNEVALYYDQQLPRGAPERVEANFEAAWAHLLRGDMQRTLGAVYGARSPDQPHPLQSELHLLAGAALVGLCQVEHARAELDALKRDHTAHLPALVAAVAALDAGAKPRTLLGAAGGLPEAARAALQADPRVARALAAEAALTVELARVEAIAADAAVDLSALGRRGVALLSRDGARVHAAVRAAANDLIATWTRLDEAADALLVDLLEAEGETLEAAIRGRDDGGSARAGEVTVLGEDWQRWAVDTVWWPDELGTYRSTLPNRCAKGAE